jgi:hypothetical protein
MIFTEAPITEYERSRNEEIMKNNRELERLGIKTLVPIVNNTSVKRKGEDHEVSGSLYTGQESEDCEDEDVISKVPSLLSICLFVLYCFLLCVSMLFSKLGANFALVFA